MKSYILSELMHETIGNLTSAFRGPTKTLSCAAALMAAGILFAGCQTNTANHQAARKTLNAPNSPHSEDVLSIREGDVVRISFPGAPNLNTSQQVRRDGQITLPLGGETRAAGLTTAELEKQLADRYASQLVSKEVSVTIDSSSFPIFVTGAVLRPGKIISNRPMTALEAVMEAGGFDYNKANLKTVTVIRQDGDRVQHYKVNLKLPLQGKPSEPFYLKPSDIVFVPERFAWF